MAKPRLWKVCCRWAAWRTYGVEALEKVLWGELPPAVLHIHAPIELPVLTI